VDEVDMSPIDKF